MFVVMPYGTKAVPKRPRLESPAGSTAAAPTDEAETALLVDFDAVYLHLLAPAIAAAGCQPFRADEEAAAGSILKDMFAELVTADFVLADISILNANVFYELGVRHGTRRRGTICLHAGWSDRPFDIAPDRTFRYDGKLFAASTARDPAWEKDVAREVQKLTRTLERAIAADRTTEGSPVYGNLPKLKPVDASEIETARFQFYQDLAEDWECRIATAGKDGRAEDILTLAGDVPSPYYRRRLLRQCGEALLALGRFKPAERIFRELQEEYGSAESPDALRVRCQLALIANRLGRSSEAQVDLTKIAERWPGDPEVQGQLGRVYKDLWRTHFTENPGVPVTTLADRRQAAWSYAALARKSLRSYAIAVRGDLRSFYNGINVLTLARLLDHLAVQLKKPARVEVADAEDLAAAVRLAASGQLTDESRGIWARATLGELHLIQNRPTEALASYEEATAEPNVTWFQIATMLDQVRLLESLELHPEGVQPVIALLRDRLTERAHPYQTFRKIAICSGHRVDDAARKEARFPAAKEPAVKERIVAQLANWNLGEGDLAICGGACGADILFAEACLARGARVRLLLARGIEAFVESSVHMKAGDWVARFHRLRERCEVATQPDRLGPVPERDATANASQFPDVYSRNNLWLLNSARIEADDTSQIRCLLVWDERPVGDGPGGTADFAAQARRLGAEISIINPTQL